MKLYLCSLRAIIALALPPCMSASPSSLLSGIVTLRCIFWLFPKELHPTSAGAPSIITRAARQRRRSGTEIGPGSDDGPQRRRTSSDDGRGKYPAPEFNALLFRNTSRCQRRSLFERLGPESSSTSVCGLVATGLGLASAPSGLLETLTPERWC